MKACEVLTASEQLVITLSPEKTRICLEGVHFDEPAFVQCLINRDRKLLIFRRCGKRDYGATALEHSEGEIGSYIGAANAFFWRLYRIMGLASGCACRLKSETDMQLEAPGYVFDLANAEVLRDEGMNDRERESIIINH